MVTTYDLQQIDELIARRGASEVRFTPQPEGGIGCLVICHCAAFRCTGNTAAVALEGALPPGTLGTEPLLDAALNQGITHDDLCCLGSAWRDRKFPVPDAARRRIEAFLFRLHCELGYS